MKTVSEEYRQSMAQPLRERSHVRVVFGNVDTTAMNDASWKSQEKQMWWSNTDTLTRKYKYGATIATTELNRNILGSNFEFADSQGAEYRDGFVSSALSPILGQPQDPNQDIAVLQCTLRKPHTIPGLTIRFDSRMKEWPYRISVRYLDASKVLIKQLEQVEVDNYEYTVELAAENVSYILIAFKSMLPYRHPRVEKVTFGVERVFDNDDIKSMSQKHDIDPLSRRAPKGVFSFSIFDPNGEYDFDAPNGIWKFIDEQSPISVRYGYELPTGIEWLEADNYVLSGRPTFKNGVATFKATDLLGRMSGTFYKAQLGPKNLYDMAVEVLQDANLPLRSSGKNPWSIDLSLKNITTDGFLPIAKHIDCLQMIAHAAGCRLYVNASGYIKINPFGIRHANADSLYVDNNSILEKSQEATKIATLKKVEVKCYNYTKETEEVLLYSNVVGVGILHAEFQAAADVRIEVIDGRASEQHLYAQAANMRIHTATKATVNIYGKPLKESSTTYVKQVAPDGQVDVEKNQLITSESMASDLADHVAEYLQLRNTYKMSYRGNPEVEARDVIRIDTKYSIDLHALVLVEELTFNGSLHGKLVVKGIPKTAQRRLSL